MNRAERERAKEIAELAGHGRRLELAREVMRANWGKHVLTVESDYPRLVVVMRKGHEEQAVYMARRLFGCEVVIRYEL